MHRAAGLEVGLEVMVVVSECVLWMGGGIATQFWQRSAPSGVLGAPEQAGCMARQGVAPTGLLLWGKAPAGQQASRPAAHLEGGSWEAPLLRRVCVLQAFRHQLVVQQLHKVDLQGKRAKQAERLESWAQLVKQHRNTCAGHCLCNVGLDGRAGTLAICPRANVREP